MNDKAKKAEKALRDRLQREREVYGMIPAVENCELISDDERAEIELERDENTYYFSVNFEGRPIGRIFSVKVYSKSYRIWQE